jgi:glycosyltransferase involved in cell wall biosynthesis
MKIAIADNQQVKFDNDIVDHWIRLGHEVKYEMGFSENLYAWADLYYVNFWDNNIHAMFHWYEAHPNDKKPIVVVRAIDWEIWQGLVRDQRIIDWVDHAICIAPHMERKLRSEARWGDKLHLIPCGVDATKFPLRRKEQGHNILIPCNEIDWHLKNVSEGIKIFAMLKKESTLPWKLFIRGKWCQGEYFKVFHLDLIEKLGIKDDVTIIDSHIGDYDAFMEDMDVCLVPSYKEAFSFVTGECASKGIKPVLNHWYGAEEIWPIEWIYQTPDEAVEKIKCGGWKPEEYRDYILKNKNVEDMFKAYDKILGTDKL